MMVRGRWIFATLIVGAIIVLFIRLGFWQLSRLEERRTLNANIVERTALAPLEITQAWVSDLPDTPEALKYHHARVQGEFDVKHQILLKLQKWQGSGHEALQGDPGSHLITPLRIAGTETAILVNRGWIPESETNPESLEQFALAGSVVVEGMLFTSQRLPAFGNAGGGTLDNPRLDWLRLDIDAIQAQTPYPLLPLILMQSPADQGVSDLPYPVEPSFDLSEGPHFSYAVQWFSFAIILAGVYFGYVYKHTDRIAKN